MNFFKRLSLIAALFAGTAATAGDFDNTVAAVSMETDTLYFSAETVDGDLSSLETGLTMLRYSTTQFDADLYTFVRYERLGDNMVTGLEYTMSRDIKPGFNVYGTAAVNYVTPNADLGDGDFYLAPFVGTEYEVVRNVGVFGEVGYGWNMSNDFAENGGWVEGGVDFGVTENMSVRTSLIQTFDTANDEANAKVEAVFRF